MEHSEESCMKYTMILLCLAVCTFGLGLTSQAVVHGQSTNAKAATEDKSESADAEKNGATTKAADKSADDEDDEAKEDTPATDSKPAAKEDEKEEKKKPRKTAKVEAKRVRVVATLDGTFTAEQMTPVALRPEEWSQYEIVEIVEHGTEVHEGETLV